MADETSAMRPVLIAWAGGAVPQWGPTGDRVVPPRPRRSQASEYGIASAEVALLHAVHDVPSTTVRIPSKQALPLMVRSALVRSIASRACAGPPPPRPSPTSTEFEMDPARLDPPRAARPLHQAGFATSGNGRNVNGRLPSTAPLSVVTTGEGGVFGCCAAVSPKPSTNRFSPWVGNIRPSRLPCIRGREI